MKKLVLLAAVICLIFCCGVTAEALTWSTGAVSASHYVGTTNSTNDGYAHGTVGMNWMCQQMYGQTAHMCNTDEYFQTAGVQKGGWVSQMWIQPAFHACYYDTKNSTAMCQMAGAGPVVESQYDLTCSGPSGHGFKSQFGIHRGLS